MNVGMRTLNDGHDAPSFNAHARAFALASNASSDCFLRFALQKRVGLPRSEEVAVRSHFWTFGDNALVTVRRVEVWVRILIYSVVRRLSSAAIKLNSLEIILLHQGLAIAPPGIRCCQRIASTFPRTHMLFYDAHDAEDRNRGAKWRKVKDW
jgi:hypothetical protein